MPITFDFSKSLEGVEAATFEAMPEDVKPYYEKGADGKYSVSKLARPLVDTLLGVVAGIRDERGKNTRLNAENAGRRVLTDAFESMAAEMGWKPGENQTLADAFKHQIGELTSAVKNGKDVKVNLEAIKQDFANKLDAQGKTKDAEIGKMRGALEKYLVDAAATAALASEKGNSVLLLPHVKAATKVVADGDNYVVRIVDAQGNLRVNGTGGDMTIVDLVKEMKANTTFAGAFESDTKGGSGTPPNNASNPNLRRPATGEMTSDQKMAAGLAARGVK